MVVEMVALTHAMVMAQSQMQVAAEQLMLD